MKVGDVVVIKSDKSNPMTVIYIRPTGTPQFVGCVWFDKTGIMQFNELNEDALGVIENERV